jgi:Predicted permeases
MSKWKLTLAGFVVGGLSGLLGVGGGIFIVPILVSFFAVQQHRAQAISQGVVLPTAIVSSFFYFKNGLIDTESISIAASMAVFSMFCAAYGVKVMKNLPANTLKKAFGALMVLAGIKMMWG